MFYKIDYELNNEFDGLAQIREIKTEKLEREGILNQASLMCDHYPELLGLANASKMKKLISEIQDNDDILSSTNNIEKLKQLVNDHQYIITIFLYMLQLTKPQKLIRMTRIGL